MSSISDANKAFKITETISKLIAISLTFLVFSTIAWAADNGPGAMPDMPPTGQMMPPGRGGQDGPFGQQALDVPEDIQLDRDIVFTTINGHELKLDIAYPKAGKGKLLPAIVHIHGGGWSGGDKSAAESVFFAKNGFVGVSIQYRLSGEAIFPAAVHDCKTAIRWVRANAKKYGIDPDRIGVAGDSAGGHLVALLGTSGEDPYLEGDGAYSEYSSTVQAVVDRFGPTDFAKMNDRAGGIDHDAADSPESQFLGKPVQEAPELVKKANPITYIDASDPPILMMHGEKDTAVIIEQSELLYNALTNAGVKAELVRVKNAGHMFAATPQGAEISPTSEEIEQIQVKWYKDVFGMK